MKTEEVGKSQWGPPNRPNLGTPSKILEEPFLSLKIYSQVEVKGIECKIDGRMRNINGNLTASRVSKGALPSSMKIGINLENMYAGFL